ncbi:hypothetical protein ACOSP7_032900 [Xanthoceras sorbifolium]
MASSGASVDQPVQSSSESIQSMLKRKSNDVGWEFGVLVDGKNLDKVKCILCGKIMSGGAYRMKEHIGHISGNVAACPKATPEAQATCRNEIMEAKSKKRGKRKEELLLRSQVNLVDTIEEEDAIEELGVRRGPRALGLMDRFVSGNTLNSSLSGTKTMRQQNINEAKEKTQSVNQYVCRWVYEAGIPFNAIDNDSFKLFMEAVGQFGLGYKPPSQYQLREQMLKEEVQRTNDLLKKQEEEWALNGCSIMMDAWSDRKRRSIMNLCVNCKE